jgi:hypothetical protein
MKRAGREMSDDIIVAVHWFIPGRYDSELGTRLSAPKDAPAFFPPSLITLCLIAIYIHHETLC